jgi:hypothetical protein
MDFNNRQSEPGWIAIFLPRQKPQRLNQLRLKAVRMGQFIRPEAHIAFLMITDSCAIATFSGDRRVFARRARPDEKNLTSVSANARWHRIN